jgi:GDP-L-fucose synthase
MEGAGRVTQPVGASAESATVVDPSGIVCEIAEPVSSSPLVGKRIVVTGGAGFLGSHVVDVLRARGVQEIFVPRRRDYDLVDRAACQRLLRDARPDLVFHLAARVGGIGANRDNPGLFLFENAMMGLSLLEECRLAGVEKTVITGTICAYPKHAPVPFREDDLWNGYPEETNAPYGIAKKLLLVQSQAYREQYGMNSIVLFPVNLYGPRDNFDLQTSHVIPAMIRKCLDAAESGAPEVTLWGDGSPTREFLYVEDAAEALVLAAERYDESEPVNIGTGDEVSIRDLAEAIAKATGFTGRFVWDTSKPNGQPRRRLDVTRARERFGFVAQTSLDEGLRRTVAWAMEQRAAGAL